MIFFSSPRDSKVASYFQGTLFLSPLCSALVSALLLLLVFFFSSSSSRENHHSHQNPQQSAMDGEKAAQITQSKKKKRKRKKKQEEKLQLLISSDTFLVLLGFSLMEDILFLCSFMCSQPLTLAYFLFFSSHISTLLSFLLPLLLTTILSLATFPHLGGHHPSYHLGSTCRLLVDLTLLPKQKESDPDLVSSLGFFSHIFLELQTCVDMKQSISQAQECSTQNNSEVQTHSPPTAAKGAVPISGVLKWEEFEAIGKLYNALTHEIGEYPLLKLAVKNINLKHLPSPGGVDPWQVVEEGGGGGGRGGGKEVPFERRETAESSTLQPAWVEGKGSGLWGFGSMKKDKEWGRTLACKLYEERWVKDGEVEVNEEGMDVLWEEHEDKNITSKSKLYEGDDNDDGVGKRSCRKRIMFEMVKINASRKSKSLERSLQQMPTEKKTEAKEEEEEDCDGDDDEDEGDVKVIRPFHCLQTLKSMRFGMGKMKNLSKAIKGGTNLIRSSSRRQRGA